MSIKPIHASIHWITDAGIYFDTLLALKIPSSNWIIQARAVAISNHLNHNSTITHNIIVINHAAGHDTDNGDLDNSHTTIHHNTQAINQARGETCTALAIHRHNGIATKNTESHAIASFLKDIFTHLLLV